MLSKKIFPRQNPNLDMGDFRAALQTIKSGEIFDGPLIKNFEAKIAEYVGVKYAILLNMGRAAEMLALKGLDFSPGDEIIMPSYNFPVVPIVVKMLGLKPVFIDIDPHTFNINPLLIEDKITKKTKAIFITHMCGCPCDMDKIMEIKNKYGFKLIEDAVHSFGSEYKDKKTGSFGDVSYFSFYVGKAITSFMGAVVCTNNPDIFLRMKTIVDSYRRLTFRQLAKAINYGILTYLLTKPFIFNLTVYPLLLVLNSFNSHLLDDKMSESVVIPKKLPHCYLTRFSNLQAAVGLHQLEKFEDTILRRIKNAELLSENINIHRLISLPLVPENVKHTFLYYFIQVKNREIFRKKLIFKGVDTKKDANQVCSHLDIFKDEYNYCSVSERISKENVLIPNYPCLEERDMLYLSQKINAVLKEMT